ncbi:Csu type fimbrial protein [Gaopeijia maritima]|uniref:Spore coat U domain-containing protein n=1 Tax=Gaopeijia maritima TaxID=3119007 RepID=A0ABU9E9F6_9BACT
MSRSISRSGSPFGIALIVVTALCAVGPQSLSAQSTAEFDVSITVENSCTIAVTDLDFGTVSDLTSAQDAATTGSVTCTGATPVSVSFNAGTVAGSTMAARLLGFGAETITFNLYRDSGRTEVLGDGTGGTVTIDFTSTGGADGLSVFGRTAAGQNPKPAGTYSSTITATVTW